ncbi:LysR substrate-binding domain-containing protein [Pseudomarimonas arenosa]|uniref:LysR family transcriptional regulator n=1 Tax=Pseudomarimonas arenosa TaxID=2774145 RepID=A0AAW3ZFD5_9GAMM|nr:LysR family transcriptional regulator [Pseudomarimonas arenosa]
MEDLNDFALFALVVDQQGFAAAERASGIPKSRLSRRVAALEELLGVRLLQRSTRRFAVTDVGQTVYRHARVIREEAEAARQVVDQLSGEPRGMLRISCPVSLAQQQLPQILPEFLRAHPKVRLQMLVSNRRFDVIDEGIDLAFRVRHRVDEDPGLIVKTYGHSRELLVASPRYFAENGEPSHPDQLPHHQVLSLIDDPGSQRWELQNAAGEKVKVELQPRVTAKDFPLLRRLALDGLGICLLPDTVCSDLLAAGYLQRVLPGWDLPQGVCHIVFASRRGMLPALRALIDHLDQHLPPLLSPDAAPAPCADAPSRSAEKAASRQKKR